MCVLGFCLLPKDRCSPLSGAAALLQRILGTLRRWKRCTDLGKNAWRGVNEVDTNNDSSTVRLNTGGKWCGGREMLDCFVCFFGVTTNGRLGARRFCTGESRGTLTNGIISSCFLVCGCACKRTMTCVATVRRGCVCIWWYSHRPMRLLHRVFPVYGCACKHNMWLCACACYRR